MYLLYKLIYIYIYIYKLASTNCIACVCYFMITDYNDIHIYIYIYIYKLVPTNCIAYECYLMIADNLYLHSCINRNLRNFIELLTVMRNVLSNAWILNKKKKNKTKMLHKISSRS